MALNGKGPTEFKPPGLDQPLHDSEPSRSFLMQLEYIQCITLITSAIFKYITVTYDHGSKYSGGRL